MIRYILGLYKGNGENGNYNVGKLIQELYRYPGHVGFWFKGLNASQNHVEVYLSQRHPVA